jgi:hypothetical protein
MTKTSKKYGYCKEVYGLVTTSPLSAYITLSRLAERKNKGVCLVDHHGAKLDDDAHVVIISTLGLLQSYHLNIHSEQVLIVCDGPLSLDNIKDLVPLDYVKNLSYEYTLLHTVDFNKLFLKSVASKRILWKKQDHLKIIAEQTSSDSDLIVALNKIQANANHVARHAIKGMLVEVLSGTQKKDQLIQTCVKSLSKKSIENITSLEKVIKTKKFDALSKAFQLMPESKNIEKLATTYGVQSYELRYLKQVQSDIKNRLDLTHE